MQLKSHTDIEQSKKLTEILPLESADMYYNPRPSSEIPHVGNANTALLQVPCWSLAALMHLLPSEFTTENEFGKYKYEIKIRKYKLTNNMDIHQIAYGNYKWYEDGSSSWKDMINTGEREELLDAAFDMVVWLKKNGKI